MKRHTQAVALCGVLGALAVAVMLLGAVLPIALYIAPMFAGLLVLVVREECGTRMAWTMYAAVSLLGVLFVPDKEVVFTFIFIAGYYPLVKPRLDALCPLVLRLSAKLLLFNGSVLVMYGILMLLFFPSWMQMQWNMAELLFTGVILLLGNAAFFLYDKAVVNLLRAYRLLWQPRLHRMLR